MNAAISPAGSILCRDRQCADSAPSIHSTFKNEKGEIFHLNILYHIIRKLFRHCEIVAGCKLEKRPLASFPSHPLVTFVRLFFRHCKREIFLRAQHPNGFLMRAYDFFSCICSIALTKASRTSI